MSALAKILLATGLVLTSLSCDSKQPARPTTRQVQREIPTTLKPGNLRYYHHSPTKIARPTFYGRTVLVSYHEEGIATVAGYIEGEFKKQVPDASCSVTDVLPIEPEKREELKELFERRGIGKEIKIWEPSKKQPPSP